MKNKKGSSPFGFLFGFVFIIGAICLLWWNEGRTVANQKAIGEVKKNYKEVKSDKIDSKNDGKLVVTSGEIVINDEEPLKDSSFEVEVKSVKLSRVVEVYQYEEKCTEDDDRKSCSYNKVWSEDLIDSSDFENKSYVNPTSKAIESESFYANDVDLGAFNLPSELYTNVSTNAEFKDLTEEVADKNNLTVNGNYYTTYVSNPAIGDMRISFKYSDLKEGTVLAVQDGDTFKAYTSKNNIKYFRLYEQILTGPEVIKKLVDENNLLKWILRAVGVIVMFLGFMTLLSPLTWLASKIPVIGNIINSFTGFIGFLVSLALSLVVIAIAWLRFRPIIAIVLICIIVGIIVLLIFLQKKNKKVAVVNEE